MRFVHYIKEWGEDSTIEQSGARYAGFWRRFVSVIIDMALFTPLYLAVIDLPLWLGELIFTGIAVTLFSYLFSSRWRASPGMRLMRVYVVDTHNQKISFWHALIWCLTSIVGMTLCLIAVIYIKQHIDINAINSLLIFDEQVRANLAQGIVDQRLLHLLGDYSLEDYIHTLRVILLITVVLLFVWSLAIVLPHNKAGFHNWLCKTRFLVGRV